MEARIAALALGDDGLQRFGGGLDNSLGGDVVDQGSRGALARAIPFRNGSPAAHFINRIMSNQICCMLIYWTAI